MRPGSFFAIGRFIIKKVSPILIPMALMISISMLGMLGCNGSSPPEDDLSTAVTLATTPNEDGEILKPWLADAGLPEDMSEVDPENWTVG